MVYLFLSCIFFYWRASYAQMWGPRHKFVNLTHTYAHASSESENSLGLNFVVLVGWLEGGAWWVKFLNSLKSVAYVTTLLPSLEGKRKLKEPSYLRESSGPNSPQSHAWLIFVIHSVGHLCSVECLVVFQKSSFLSLYLRTIFSSLQHFYIL